jgi:hypothetical protein
MNEPLITGIEQEIDRAYAQRDQIMDYIYELEEELQQAYQDQDK